MESKHPMPGLGHFRWNGGGWFGSQFGGTAWMLVGAVLLAPHAPEVAAIWLACFAAANAVGWAIWGRRDRLRPFPAMQGLLLACGIAGAIALVALRALRPGLIIDEPPGMWLATGPGSIFSYFALVASLMATFHLMERRARAGGSRPEGKGPA